MTTPIKAIVVAAGRGRRLMPFTDEMPKCLVPLKGRPLLLRQLDMFRAHGVKDAVVIRGYKADVLERRKDELGPGVRFVENPEYEQNNILLSLFTAESELSGPLLLTYADIVFAKDVVARLMTMPGDIVLVVDRDFRLVYEGRNEHPLSEAEVCELDDHGFVKNVGKRAVPAERAVGEFIGLAKLTSLGATAFREAWKTLVCEYAGREHEPFQRAPSWQIAYLTDLLQHLIDRGAKMVPLFINGSWREIDTVEDLRRAETTVDW